MMDMASPSRHLTLLLLALAATTVIAAPDLSICDPSNYTYPYDGPALPKLPRQYHLTVEANIANRNYSMMLEEFYDEINNRGASVAPYGNSTYHTSYDYRLNQTVMVVTDNVNGNASCKVSDLATNRFNLFGFHVENGSGHINGSDAIFRFGEEFNETYIGRTTVRGIPANQWQRCIYHENNNKTYLLDFYFSDPLFKLPYGASEIPLRATLNGSAVNATGPRRAFYHNYEYLEVKPGPVEKERAFEPPLGVHCPGYKSIKEFPPFPEVFSFDVESVHPGMKEIHFLKESYNYPAKLVSYSYRPWNQTSQSRLDAVREVHDYNIGLSYKLDYMSEECSIGPIPVHMYPRDADSTDGIHVSLRSPHNFLLHNQTEWIYEGNTTLRDVDAEAWITAGTWTNATHSSNFTLEYIFARTFL